MGFKWTDDPLSAGSIFYKEVHLTELHVALHQVYTDVGLTEDDLDTWKTSTFPIFYAEEENYPYRKNDWIYEIRDAINNGDLLDICGYESLADLLNTAIGQNDWTDPTLEVSKTFNKNNHIEELRRAIESLIGWEETWENEEVQVKSDTKAISGNDDYTHTLDFSVLRGIHTWKCQNLGCELHTDIGTEAHADFTASFGVEGGYFKILANCHVKAENGSTWSSVKGYNYRAVIIYPSGGSPDMQYSITDITKLITNGSISGSSVIVGDVWEDWCEARLTLSIKERLPDDSVKQIYYIHYRSKYGSVYFIPGTYSVLYETDFTNLNRNLKDDLLDAIDNSPNVYDENNTYKIATIRIEYIQHYRQQMWETGEGTSHLNINLDNIKLMG